MKIVVTISDFGAAAHIGGDVERESEIMEIPDDIISPMLKVHLEKRKRQRKAISEGVSGECSYYTCSLSLLVED